MPPTVEVLVVSYASAAEIEHLLASLVAHLPDAPVAIREHAGDPAACAVLAQIASAHTAPVRIEHDPTNPGFGAGCNALAAGSTAEFLAFFNPDTELLAWPWSPADPPPRGAVIGPVMADAAHQHYGRRFRVRDEIALSWLRRRPRRPTGRGYVSGAAMLIERTEFARIGGFDPGYFMFYEDIDLCVRANAAGVATLVAPGWSMRHARHSSTATSDRRFADALRWSYESAVRFHGAQGSPVWAYRAYVVADAAGRAVVHALSGRGGRARGYLRLARIALGGSAS